MNKVYVASEGVRNCVERVAKVEGKGLSTNDFTNEYLNKVNSLEQMTGGVTISNTANEISWGNGFGYV